MKYLSFLFLLLLSFSISNSKESIFEFEKDNHHYFLSKTSCDEKYFYLTEDVFKIPCKIRFFRLDFENNKLDSFYVDVPLIKGVTCNVQATSIKDFIFRDNKLYLLLYFNLLIFDNINGEYVFRYDYNLSEMYIRNYPAFSERLVVENDTIVGLYDSYQSRLRESNGVFTWKISPNNNNIIDTTFIPIDTNFIPNVKGFKWTQIQPKTIIDYHKGQFVYSDIEDDKIYLFKDKDDVSKIDLNIFDNASDIKSDELNMFGKTYESTDDEGDFIHPQVFYDMKKRTKDETFLVHNVSFLNEDNILVVYSIPKKNDTETIHLFNYCLVRKKGEDWIVKDKINPEHLLGDNKLENKDHYGNNYKISNGKLISFHSPNYKNKLIPNFIRIEDINDVLNRIK